MDNFKRISGIRTEKSKIDRLTADEEKDLSAKIRAGGEAEKELSQGRDLSDAERQALLKTAEIGNEAFDRLVLANLPRAVKTAAEAYRKNQYGLNEFDDYKQTALVVTCKCARTFDGRCRFGTYVHRSLVNEMIRENARNGYAVRIPEELLPAVSRLKRMLDAADDDGSPETAGLSDELSAACRIPKRLQSPVSREDEDTELGDMIADPAALTAEEIDERIDREELVRRAKLALAGLPEEERRLLEGRFGFGGEPLPMRAFVGSAARSVSGVQKKQLQAEKHLREIYFSLPLAD